MKERWSTPEVMVQVFEPNEYVAACWGVGCSVDDANQIEKNMKNYDYPNLYHGKDHCGTSGNQVIYDDNNDNVADRMVEVGTDGLGNLSCKLYTDSNYSTTRAISTVKVGDIIYWTTTATDQNGHRTRVWHHVGQVFSSVPGHPNRS